MVGVVIDHLHRGVGAGGQFVDDLFGANRTSAASRDIEQLHHHIGRIRRAAVEDGDCDAHRLTLGRVGRDKLDIAGQDHEIGRGRRGHGQRAGGDIVAFIGFGDEVVGIDGNLNAPFAVAPFAVEQHLGHDTATGGDAVDDLRAADRCIATGGGIDKLHYHIIGIMHAMI